MTFDLRHGDCLDPVTGMASLPDGSVDHFLSYVMPEPNSGCWLWLGSGDGRDLYGRTAIRGRQMGAHRASWVLHVGAIPDGLCVLHKCDNHICVNPGHLYLGTQLENARDREARHRRIPSSGDRHFSRTRPELLARGDRNGSRLHPERLKRGEENARARLTERDVREARRKWRAGATIRALSREYKLARSAMRSALCGKTWAHVRDEQ